MDVLTPLRRDKPETARKVKQRLRQIFSWAVAYGYIDTNPVDDALEELLPKVAANVQHFASLPYQDVAEAVQRIRHSQGMRETRLALEFLVLTACRSSEVRGARWDEIDLDAGVWTIPAGRMKAGRNHRVPLSIQARVMLQEAQEAVAKRKSTDRTTTPTVTCSPIRTASRFRVKL